MGNQGEEVVNTKEDEDEKDLNGIKDASKEVRLAKSKKLMLKKFSSYLEGEEVLNSFTCTLIGKILLTGKMYVTNMRVLHRSLFNDKTLFGKGSRVSIMHSEILHLEIRNFNNMKMFPNTIFFKVQNPKGETIEYTFTSFVYSSRNKCFELIK